MEGSGEGQSSKKNLTSATSQNPGTSVGVTPDSSSLASQFEQSATRHSDRTGVSFLGSRIAYSRLVDHVQRLATALEGLGINKGDRVAIILPNIPQFVISFYSILYIGASVVPISPLNDRNAVRSVLAESGASAVICLDVSYERILKAAEGTRSDKLIVTGVGDYLPTTSRLLGRWTNRIPQAPVRKAKGIFSYGNLIRSRRKDAASQINPKESIAVLAYTSGTTEVPRGVVLTHLNVSTSFAQAKSAVEGRITNGNEVIISALPLSHVYGMLCVMHFGLLSGQTLVLFPRAEPKKILEAIERQRATILFGVPMIYRALTEDADFGLRNLNSLKISFSSGDQLSEEVARKLLQFAKCTIVEGYGLTEATCMTHCNPLQRPKSGTMGLPIPGTLSGVVDPSTLRFLQPNQVGEVVVSGPQVTRGYWSRTEESAKLFFEDHDFLWLRTGDFAYVDVEGYFHFMGRSEDVIHHKGAAIYPSEVETIISRHPNIKMVAVLGLPHRDFGEEVVAVVIPKEESEGNIKANDVIDYCKDKLDQERVPTRIFFRDAIPVTQTGKVCRGRLKQDLARLAQI